MLLESTPLVTLDTQTRMVTSWFGTVQRRASITRKTVRWAASRIEADGSLSESEATHTATYETGDYTLRNAHYVGIRRETALCEWEEIYETPETWEDVT